MELLIIILIFVIGVKDCRGYSYKEELKEITYQLSLIVNRLEKLSNEE